MYKVPASVNMPRKFNTHVVLDMRVGTTYEYPAAKSGPHAISIHMRAMGEDEMARHTPEERESVVDFITDTAMQMITGQKPDHGGVSEVIVAGPFACLGGTTDMKNRDLVTKRYAALVNGESIVGDEDYKLHQWMIGKWAEQEEVYKLKHEAQKAERAAVAAASKRMGL